ncbi:hypothetical protein [Botrimarina colliarenosi]|nr:hypothetical protein [Botrimarina colliarenosi]
MSRRRWSGWRLVLFARCEEASRIDSDEWDGPVSRARWWAARLHRVGCGPCQHEARQMRWLRRMLASAPAEVRAKGRVLDPEPRLSDRAAERIRAALAEARRTESE